MRPGKSKDFVFRAREGQTLTLSFTVDTNDGSLDFWRAAAEPNGDPPEMVITTNKDYTFSVSNSGDKTASFKVSIGLRNPKKTGKKS